MRIVICLKQVPRLDQVRFDERNRVVREEVEAMVNPLDLRALGQALRLRDQHGGEVVALTMGPPGAREALEEVVRRGADRAVHLVDKRFGGADTLATARAIARALEREEPELVLFGRSTLDGATAQVPPEVAELAGLPQLTQATELELEEGRLRGLRETERGSEEWTIELPAAVSVERGPDPPDPDPGRHAEIREVTAEDLGGTPRDYGTRGSPTFVKEVRELSLEREAEVLQDVEAGAERLEHLLSERVRAGERKPAPQEPVGGERRRALWVLAERDEDDGLHPVSLEGIACARKVAGELDAEVVAVLLCADPEGLAEELAAHGPDRVLVVRDPSLGEFTTAAHAQALCAALHEHDPYAVVAPWSASGRDYLPRAAARLGLGLTGDFVELEVSGGDDEEPDLLWIKPAWAGTVHSPIIARTRPALGTLRPGVFAPPERRDDAEVPIEEFEPGAEPEPGPQRKERRREVEGELLLDSAPVVVCAGAELDREAVERARGLAAALGGSLGATAGAIERGLAVPQLEVGILKRSIAPLLCLMLGVREEEPLDAVRAARTIVTVHADADAPAHGRADLAVVASPREFAATLLERLGARG